MVAAAFWALPPVGLLLAGGKVVLATLSDRNMCWGHMYATGYVAAAGYAASMYGICTKIPLWI